MHPLYRRVVVKNVYSTTHSVSTCIDTQAHFIDFRLKYSPGIKGRLKALGKKTWWSGKLISLRFLKTWCGAVVQLQHNETLTQDSYLFSSIFEHPTCPSASSVTAPSFTFKTEIYFWHIAPGSAPDLDGFRWSAASSHLSRSLLNNSVSGSCLDYKSLLESRTTL